MRVIKLSVDPADVRIPAAPQQNQGKFSYVHQRSRDPRLVAARPGNYWHEFPPAPGEEAVYVPPGMFVSCAAAEDFEVPDGAVAFANTVPALLDVGIVVVQAVLPPGRYAKHRLTLFNIGDTHATFFAKPDQPVVDLFVLGGRPKGKP